jgi:general secretion pathway protein C
MSRAQVVSRSISPQVWPALVTALVWSVAAAGTAYWVLQWPSARTEPVPEVTVGAATPAGDTAQMARALGQVQALAATAPEVSRFQLMGVISFTSGRGSALIAVDGQPPKAWRVGQAVQEGVYLQKLAPRQAWLGSSPSGPAQWTLNMAGPDRP